jgi:hypothetical protein
MKTILSTTIIIIAAIVLYLDFGPKYVTGRVVDQSGKGVPGITVEARQRSWDWRPELVKSKDFFYYSQTDSEGNFKLAYKRGGPEVHLLFYRMDKDPDMKKYEIEFWEHPIVRYP